MKNFRRFFKKISCVSLIYLLSFSTCMVSSGCTPKKEWVFKSENITLTSDEYVYYLFVHLLQANQMVAPSENMFMQQQNTDIDLKKLQEGKIKGKPALDWVKDETIKQLKTVIISKIYADRVGISETMQSQQEMQMNQIELDSIIDKLNQEMGFADLGISKQTMCNILENEIKMRSLHENLFKEGGEQYITEEELTEFIKNHYVKSKQISISKEIDLSETNESKEDDKSDENVEEPKENSKVSVGEWTKGLLDKLKNKQATLEDIQKEVNKVSNKNKDKDEESEDKDQKEQEDENISVESKVDFKKSSDESEEDEENLLSPTNSSLVNMISEMAIDSDPELKEDDMNFYIVLRESLEDEDIQNVKQQANQKLAIQKFNNFIKEQMDLKNVQINESMVNKYSSLKIAEKCYNHQSKMKKNQPKFP